MSFRKIYASLPAQRLDSAIDQIIDQPIKLSSPHATYGPGEMLTIIRITNEAITMKPFSFVISKVARVRSEVFTRGEITPTDGSGDRAGNTFFRDPRESGAGSEPPRPAREAINGELRFVGASGAAGDGATVAGVARA